MTSVFSFRPEYFNNNGDQGNIEALEHFTGSKFTRAEISGADFVLFGDASRAAMREFREELEAFVSPLEKRLKEGSPTLLVGSSYEFFAARIKAIPDLKYGDRVSEFRTAMSSGFEVKGYRNSEILGSDLFMSGMFVGTTLFGPVLAKNLALADAFAKSLGLTASISVDERNWIEKL
jgi:CobQ-like glutamine amidotransferase family enzyme